MRLVLDTNLVLSALLWGGTPGRLIEAAESRQARLIVTPALLNELWDVLVRPKFNEQFAKRRTTPRNVFDDYKILSTLVAPATIAAAIVRDPADDHVLAAALGGRADLIVSGDAHLLDLKRYLGIDIVTPTIAVARLTPAA